jgi:ABC-type Fe3+/spermidine/putrescine transport system ATPase subunit
MNRGAIEQIGEPQEVYLRPRTRFVAGFLGEVNWLDGVGVRPEAMRIARDAAAECNGMRRREGEVTGMVFLGDRSRVQVRLKSGEQVVAQVARDFGSGGGSFCAGQRVELFWLAGDEMRFD